MATASRTRTVALLLFAQSGWTMAHGGGTEYPIFHEPQSYTFFANDWVVAAGDFNEDGLVDLMSTTPTTTGSFGRILDDGIYTLKIQRDNADFSQRGPFIETFPDEHHGGHTIVAEDFNGDGHVDIASVDILSSTPLTVLLGHGDGTFEPTAGYPNTGRDMAAGDMDNDGDIDLVLSNGGHVVLNDGNGNFFINGVAGDVEFGGDIALGDLDEDGYLDIVTTPRTSFTPSLTHVNVQLNSANGAGDPLPAQPLFIGGGSPKRIALADMDSNGHLDLVVMIEAPFDGEFPTALGLLLGNGDGTFQAPEVFAAHNAGYYIGFNMLAEDLDLDGQPELAVTSTVIVNVSSHAETAIFEYDHQSGALVMVENLVRLGTASTNMIAVDINNDGSPDLVTPSHISLNRIEAGCSLADLAEPFGTLDFFDISSFINAFAASTPDADLAEPFGAWDFFDVSAFLNAYNDGCP